MNPVPKSMFQDNEKLVLRFGIGLISLSVALFLIMLAVLRLTEVDAEVFLIIVFALLVASVVLFVTSVVRIVIFLTKVKNLDKTATISKSMITLVISVISFFIQFLLMIVIALSNFS